MVPLVKREASPYGILTVLYCTVVHRVRGTCCVWDMSMATWREPAVYTTNTRKSRTRSSGHALPYRLNAIKFRYISLHRSSGAHAGGVQGGRVLSPGLVPALARPRLLRVAQLTRPACELIRILPPRVDKRCGRPITLPQPADSRLPNRCGGRWLPCVDAKVEPECVGHCVSARRVLLRRAITGGAIRCTGEVVSACQAIPCLRCPCNRPAGDVVITEHWLDRCVQAEKGPYLLRDHRPVRLHIFVAQDQEARSRECGTPRPQTRRVVIGVVVCRRRPTIVESACRAPGAILQGRAGVPMEETLYRPRSTYGIA